MILLLNKKFNTPCPHVRHLTFKGFSFTIHKFLKCKTKWEKLWKYSITSTVPNFRSNLIGHFRLLVFLQQKSINFFCCCCMHLKCCNTKQVFQFWFISPGKRQQQTKTQLNNQINKLYKRSQEVVILSFA